MKIPEIKSTRAQSAKKAKRTGEAGGSSFTEHLTPAAGPPSEQGAREAVGAVAPVNSIISVQEVVGDVNDDQQSPRLIKWGENILDQLEQIRHDLLLGAIPLERLNGLAKALRDRKANISDPELLSLINDIELRAEVEIAKYSRNI